MCFHLWAAHVASDWVDGPSHWTPFLMLGLGVALLNWSFIDSSRALVSTTMFDFLAGLLAVLDFFCSIKLNWWEKNKNHWNANLAKKFWSKGDFWDWNLWSLKLIHWMISTNFPYLILVLPGLPKVRKTYLNNTSFILNFGIILWFKINLMQSQGFHTCGKSTIVRNKC